MVALLPLAVVLPMAGAGVTLIASRRPKLQRMLSVSALAAQLVVALAMLVWVDNNGAMVMHIGGWSAPFGITLVADRLAAFMLVVSTTVTLAVLVYAIAQGREDEGGGGESETPVSIFHPTFLILATGVSNAFLSGDLFNLFVSFEILLTASYVLLTLGGTKERLRAGAPYIVVSLLSSIIFLSAIALIYAATGTVNLADLAGKLDTVPPGIKATLGAVLLVAFGVKAAVFPMSAWLPDSYPTAPAPVTAVFAGLLTKVGVYAIIRVQTLLFPGSYGTLLMIAGGLTMLVGILGAVVQPGIKRLLSFTLVSHIGYMIFGVGLASAAGISAAIFYVAHHILVQTALFLASGLIERVAGTTMLARLGGLASAAPVLAVLFFIPAMNLAGVPPLSGFLGKVGLFEAALADGRVLPLIVVGVGALTSLLTLYAIVRMWGRTFWRPVPEGVDDDHQHDHGVDPDTQVGRTTTGAESGMSTGTRKRATRAAARRRTQDEVARLPGGMIGATTAMVAVGLVLTIGAGPVYAFTQRAADNLMDPAVYVNAVTSTTGDGEDELRGSVGGTAPDPAPASEPTSDPSAPSEAPAVDGPAETTGGGS
ncbi:Na+/H+ antiporter subunit D [Nakamurella flavida]|uniref:Na+/H+ antiporter subunit D n=2 Tax=Nakamurella flavida TaxID=363630 RepID=A0A939C437_9ACTN|nr:Na+/H+ antiporter subunit D [Nakamurella flavida]